jgi:hypothetical protein
MTKTWWLAVAICAGCATNDKPDIDATGTVNASLTYGGGNCAKTGSEPFKLHLQKNGYASYDITQDAVGQHISGDVVCGGYYCEIHFFKDWQNNNNDLLSLDGTLTLEGETNKISGNGTYKALGDCEQQVTFAGALE